MAKKFSIFGIDEAWGSRIFREKVSIRISHSISTYVNVFVFTNMEIGRGNPKQITTFYQQKLRKYGKSNNASPQKQKNKTKQTNKQKKKTNKKKKQKKNNKKKKTNKPNTHKSNNKTTCF